MDEYRQNAKLLRALCICAAAAVVLSVVIKMHRRSLERIAEEKAWDAYLISIAEEGTALDADGHRAIDAAMANVQNVGLAERYMLNGNFADALDILDKIESVWYEKKMLIAITS